MHLIDIGANLTHESFRHDLDAVLERARKHGVERMIVTGASRAGSEHALELARAHPGTLYATAGVHPHHAGDYGADTDALLRAFAREPEVVAVGETGLDYYRDLSPRPAQRAAFEYLDLDCHVGITGWICDERRGLQLRELVREIPAHRLMLETDAPYLLPRDIRPQPSHRRNEPMYLAHICEVVAGLRGEAPEATAANATAATRAFFGIA